MSGQPNQSYRSLMLNLTSRFPIAQPHKRQHPEGPIDLRSELSEMRVAAKLTEDWLVEKPVDPTSITAFSLALYNACSFKEAEKYRVILRSLFLRKSYFFGEYLEMTVLMQCPEFLSDFLINFIKEVRVMPRDIESMLLLEGSFYSLLFLSENNRIGLRVMIECLNVFSTKFGVKLAEKLLELSKHFKLEKVEPRLRLLLLLRGDHEQIKHLGKLDDWNKFLILSLILNQTPNETQHEREPEEQDPETKHQSFWIQELKMLPITAESRFNRFSGNFQQYHGLKKALQPDLLLMQVTQWMLGNSALTIPQAVDSLYQHQVEYDPMMLHTDPLIAPGCLSEVFIRAVKAMIHRSASDLTPGERIIGLYAIYFSLEISFKNKRHEKLLTYPELKMILILLFDYLENSESSDPKHSIEFRIIVAVFSSLLKYYGEDCKPDTILKERVYTVLISLITVDSGFAQYLGLRTILVLLGHQIRSNRLSKDPAQKEIVMSLVKTSLKGLAPGELNTTLDQMFHLPHNNSLLHVSYSVRRVVESCMHECEKKVFRMQNVLNTLYEDIKVEGCAPWIHTEVWGFLKRLI